MPAIYRKAARLPLHALLSKALVAYTIEFDGEFERQMSEAGYIGACLSLVVWANLIRFIPDSGVSVRELAAAALSLDEQIKHQLGCLERWRFVVLQSASRADQSAPRSASHQSREGKRDGWGSGRGIRAEWIVRLTAKGRKAAEIWPPLFDVIEARWQTRFGADLISRLRESAQAIVGQFEVELPHGLADPSQLAIPFPARVTRDAAQLSLPTLLSQLLLAFAITFNRHSKAPLALCANVLRVLGAKPVRAGQLPRLTGTSPETSDISWRLKPYVVVEPDPAERRGKVVRLSPTGLKAQQKYHRLVYEIEKRWDEKFGYANLQGLRDALQELFAHREGDRLAMSVGLLPPPGVIRSGTQAPALGRKTVGPAARQRMRDMVVQTEAFVSDPTSTLPDYPLWDMNRGFGP
jgi:hypothetical protein